MRLISSTTQSHVELQHLMRDRRWLLNELFSFHSTEEIDRCESQFSLLEHLQTNDWWLTSSGPDTRVHSRPQQYQHHSANSVMGTPQATPPPVSWSILSSIPAHHQQPGPEEIPWPQPRPQAVQRTPQDAVQSEPAPTSTEDAMNSLTAPQRQDQGSAAQPARANAISPLREVPREAPNNSSSRRPMRNITPLAVTRFEPPHPQAVFTANLPPGQAQFAERAPFSHNHQSQEMQGNLRLPALPFQRPAARNENPVTVGIRNNGDTVGLILPPLPTAAPAA